MPCRNRAPISISWFWASPHSSEATVNTARPVRNMWRRPIRSPSRPARSSSPPKAIRYAFTTQARLDCEKPRSLWIEGSATVTIVPSRMIMSIPAQSTTSARQRVSRVDAAVSLMLVPSWIAVTRERTVSNRSVRNDLLRHGRWRSRRAPPRRFLALGRSRQPAADEPVEAVEERTALALGQRGQHVGVGQRDDRVGGSDDALSLLRDGDDPCAPVAAREPPLGEPVALQRVERHDHRRLVERALLGDLALRQLAGQRPREHAVRARRDAELGEPRGQLGGQRIAGPRQQEGEVGLGFR